MEDITIIQDSNGNLGSGKHNFSKGYLAIPFDGDQFRDFITGLLGKPQSIRKNINGPFEVYLKDLQNLHDLIDQRITQQNNGKLIQLTCKIYFDDDSFIQLGSIDELVTYNEIRPLSSIAVILSWDYLIQFADKAFPEKQQIEISINVPDEYPTYLTRRFLLRGHGIAVINIQHTARSWGLDLENILTHQLMSLKRKENKVKTFLMSNEESITATAIIVFFLTSITGAFIITKSFIDEELLYVKGITSNRSTVVTQKIDFLASYIASGTSSLHYFKVGIFILISLLFCVVIGAWVNAAINSLESRTFIILTKKAQDQYNEVLRQGKKNLKLVALSFIGTLASGVISNIIFKLLVE